MKSPQILAKRFGISRYISTFVLVVFLCASLSHSEHVTSQTSMFEQQDCYLCYQGLDTVETNLSISLFAVNQFITVAVITPLMLAHTPYFGQPLLRAPPAF